MKIAVYSRKSKFTGKGESIENQVSLCREYIKTHIPEACDNDIIVFEDEGFSAKNLDRPRFKEMMKIENEQPFDYIIVYRLDRISRNVGDFANLIEKLNEQKTSFVCIKEQFDTSTPMGRAMMNISAVFAQLERETIAERIRDNIVLLARTGRWLGGVTPLGFTGEKLEIKDAEGKRRFAYKLSPVKEEISRVKTIYEKFLEFHSLTKTTSWLIANGIKSRGGNDFRTRAVRDILKNPVYCTADENSLFYFEKLGCDVCFTKDEISGKRGIMPFCRTAQSGKKTRRTSFDEWIIALGKHKGIINSEEWIKTQNLLGQNTSKSFYKPSRNTVAIFTGLVKCGKCGHNMRPRITSRNADNTERFSYMCEYKERSRKMKCDMKNVCGNELDKIVCEEILKLAKIDKSVKHELSLLTKNIPENDNSAEIKNQIAHKEKEISKLMRAFAGSDNTTFGYAENEIKNLGNEIQILNEELSRIEIKKSDNLDVEAVADELLKFSDRFDELTVVEKREFVNKVVEKIIWDGENVHIYLK